MTEIKTDSALLEALLSAAKRQPSAAEIEAQRISFIMGSLGDKSQVTRRQVTEILAAHEGRKVA